MDSVRHNHSDDTSELLSAYVDGAVDISERRRAEGLVESCPACAQQVGELRALKTMLRELPSVSHVRSFTLDPATAPHPRRLLFPMLRLATMLSAVLLFVVLGVDALGGPAGATDAAQVQTTAAEYAAPESAKQDPLLSTQAEQEGMGVMSASEPAQNFGQASAAAAAAEQAAPAADASAAAASTEAAAPAAAAPQTDVGESDGGGGAASAEASAAMAADASQAPEAAAIAPPDAAGGTAAASTPAEMQRSDRSADEVTARPLSGPAPAVPFDTLRVAEILLALAAAALGIGALWAWRTGR